MPCYRSCATIIVKQPKQFLNVAVKCCSGYQPSLEHWRRISIDDGATPREYWRSVEKRKYNNCKPHDFLNFDSLKIGTFPVPNGLLSFNASIFSPSSCLDSLVSLNTYASEKVWLSRFAWSHKMMFKASLVSCQITNNNTKSNRASCTSTRTGPTYNDSRWGQVASYTHGRSLLKRARNVLIKSRRPVLSSRKPRRSFKGKKEKWNQVCH